jgi:maltose-binding protein MalE
MVWDPALNALGAILRNQSTARKALEEAQRKIISYIKEKKAKPSSR